MMRKLILAIIVLFATSFIYVGCTPESLDQHDTESLEKDELDDDDI